MTSSRRSHDFVVRSHDFVWRSHDFVVRSHDFVVTLSTISGTKTDPKTGPEMDPRIPSFLSDSLGKLGILRSISGKVSGSVLGTVPIPGTDGDFVVSKA